ncbi:hypothetical protein [Methanoculleus sp.]|uniref:hypothetical protein n=1 Tax=Methanoculleus sp. TaxID=90427 RepID=UPI0025F7084D|nr:hypothetical protein [Methanoculleus sp.]MCK9319420.1 hypothetical protein [Methanoculleus sp.]
MIEVKYENIPDEMLVNYFNFLIGKVYKILPISEKEPDTLKEYLESLILELRGSKELISKLRNEGSFISLLSIIQYFIDNECTHRELKREVFKSIDIIQKLQKKYDFK